MSEMPCLVSSESEKALFEKCLTGEVDPSDEELLDFLSMFDCKKLVKPDNMKCIIHEIAHKVLIQKPQYVAECWKSIILLLKEHFDQPLMIHSVYEKLCPTEVIAVEIELFPAFRQKKQTKLNVT